MKVTIDRAVYLRSLGHVQSVVERRNTIPILSHVLLRAQDGALTLTATDMDLEIVETVDADVATPGGTTAPAHTLYDIVRKLPDGSQIELDRTADGASGTLTLNAARSRFSLGCLPVEDFPVMPSADLSDRFSLPAKDLRMMIDRTRFAISTEETRYYLNGIYLHAVQADGDGDTVLRAVATDGHRLARVEVPLPSGAENMPGVILPRKTVAELRKLIDDLDDDVSVEMSETKMRFSFGRLVLTSKLIDGTFPDYQRVIPVGNDKEMMLDSKLFAAAVDRVSTISTEKSRAVKLSLADGALTLSASSMEHGSATEKLDVDSADAALDIGFNSRYLLDITQQIEGDQAVFRLADSASPTIIQDPADGSSVYVLMPMRV